MLREVEEQARQAAQSEAKVLLTGETGVGKEVVARLVHQESTRRRAAFVVVNCAGVPDTLLESELFGHERGSFTDAYCDKPGSLQAADRGTVFFDEVGEMSIRMQGTLLRFLETAELQRVGATGAHKHVDVRVIAATNRILLDRVAEGAFREDLYYRLNVIQIDVPPLRERPDDVIPLMQHFLRSFAARADLTAPMLTAPSEDSLLAYHWPGNVRELRNVAERLVARRLVEIRPDDLRLGPPEPLTPRFVSGASPTRADVLFDRIVRQGESFWTAVYPPFMARDLTCEDLRNIVIRGLVETRGNYKALTRLFNMAPHQYKRFLGFLKKHGCHVAFQGYRDANPMATGQGGQTSTPRRLLSIV